MVLSREQNPMDVLWISYGFLRIPKDFYGFPMDSYGFLWIPKDSYGFLWISYGFQWISYGFPMDVHCCLLFPAELSLQNLTALCRLNFARAADFASPSQQIEDGSNTGRCVFMDVKPNMNQSKGIHRNV
jgi:hypothetical protein